ncbi:MAG: hypothetical protein NT062_36930 [Proteobacteria bacterium]|nr:hypothetical protein [Pseudomonadota bacterium]
MGQRDAGDVEQTAYHEAGHAVVGWALGIMPKMVRLGLSGTDELGDDLPVGETDFGQREFRLSRQAQRAIDAAGGVAELLLRPTLTPKDVEDGCRSDYWAIAVSSLGPGWIRFDIGRKRWRGVFRDGDRQFVKCETALRKARSRAELLLRRHWPTVIRLAEALLSAPRNILEGEDLERTFAMQADEAHLHPFASGRRKRPRGAVV